MRGCRRDRRQTREPSSDVALWQRGCPGGARHSHKPQCRGRRSFAARAQLRLLFAPNYHPAFKHVAAARKLCAERGQRTIFNLLGPLLNPAQPSAMLVGVPRPEFCEPLARVLQSLGVRRAMVVCGKVNGAGFLDELSTLGENTIAEFYQERGFATSTLSPEQFPIQKAALADLLGGDKMQNAQI